VFGVDLPRDVLSKRYSRDYISELFKHFDGTTTLVEICKTHGYKLEPLRYITKQLVNDGLLEVVSGDDDQVILRRPQSESI
jgi:DNA-binding IscR family transcriptional regulator